MTMTMAIQTNRAKRLIKMLQRLLKQEQLYTDEQLKTMKSQLKVIKEELAVAEAKKLKRIWKMNVELISITPDAEKTMAHIARVSNPSNQDNPNYLDYLNIVLNTTIGLYLNNHQ